jgi:hypothetical protein
MSYESMKGYVECRREITMNKQFLNSFEDINWLFDVHLPDYPLWHHRTKSFILEGNEDCPKSVELYEKANPLVTDKPFMVHEFDW